MKLGFARAESEGPMIPQTRLCQIAAQVAQTGTGEKAGIERGTHPKRCLAVTGTSRSFVK